MCTRENLHVNVSIQCNCTNICFCTSTVKHQQRVIWSLVSLSSGSSQPLMPLGSTACIKALAHEQEICLVSPKCVGVSELRLSLSPCCRDSTTLNELVSSTTMALLLLFNEYPLVCLWVGECLSSKMQGCYQCLSFPMESFVLHCHPYISPTITMLPIPPQRNDWFSQITDILCKGGSFTAGLSKLETTSHTWHFFLSKTHVSYSCLMDISEEKQGLSWIWKHKKRVRGKWVRDWFDWLCTIFIWLLILNVSLKG